MKAMVLEAAGGPRVPQQVATPEPGPEQVLLKVAACGVCRTDLHILEGDLPDPKRPPIPGHEIVGTVVAVGSGQCFARELGCVWAGGSDQTAPKLLDAAILFASVGDLVTTALKAVRKGGRVICAGIHMSDIPSFPHRDLWEERAIQSVANLTRQDGVEFLALAARAGIKNTVTRYPLAEANQALDDLRMGRFNGAAVLIP